MRGPTSDVFSRTFTVCDSPSPGSTTVLRADDAAVVFHDQSDLLARVADLRHDDVEHERRALERLARRLDARHLDVARQPLLADADGETPACPAP